MRWEEADFSISSLQNRKPLEKLDCKAKTFGIVINDKMQVRPIIRAHRALRSFDEFANVSQTSKKSINSDRRHHQFTSRQAPHISCVSGKISKIITARERALCVPKHSGAWDNIADQKSNMQGREFMYARNRES